MGVLVACSTDVSPETKQEIIDSIQETQNQLEELETEKEAEDPCDVLFFSERELSEVEKRGYEELCFENRDWEPGGRLLFEIQCLVFTGDEEICATYGIGINETAPVVEREYSGFVLDKRCYADAVLAMLALSPTLDGRADEVNLAVQICLEPYGS